MRFGTDGIRGVANVDITPELVVALGRAAARVLDGPFVIGRDTRRSGPMLEAALVAGLTAGGAAVATMGVVPTPAVAFATAAGSGAVISASHNPFADNGIKLFAAGGRKLADDVEAALEAELIRVLDGSPDASHDGEPGGESGAAVGTVTPAADLVDGYVDHLVGALDGRTLDGVSVVVDCGHGAASRVAPRALRAAGATVTALHITPDGTNINAGCGSTDPSGLQREVVARGAAAGLAFDGDADRVIAVDERGALVDGDQILAVCARDLATRGALAHRTIAVTVMSNLGLRRALAAEQIDIVVTPVGDRHVREAMDRDGLVLGGEQSGHVIFAEHAMTGDGTLTGMLLLDVMHRAGVPLSELAAMVTRLPQELANVAVADRDGLERAADFWAEVRAVKAELGDGGRVLVRPSGTEPVVRIMVEAPTDETARALVDRLAASLITHLGAPTDA
ncbi:MAG TPA: phosphoglucosamine mutase [Acidimicrobiia bacterium]|nr:phosphoglucosamine mutase [Acidimicrobiia bacterium]